MQAGVSIQKRTFAWEGGEISGAWHRPSQGTGSGLVLAHGAGYNMNTRLLIDVAEGLSARGIAAVRFNFPYTEVGRRRPDPQRRLEACYRSVVDAVGAETGAVFLGGKSMGGRIASHIVANGVEARGLVFLGYPLHPPGQPERIRDAHLRNIRCPMLFLQGSRDAFATPELLARTIRSLPNAELVEVRGGDHSFKVPGRPAVEVTAELVEAIASFIARHTAGVLR